MNLSGGHERSLKKFGLFRFSRFVSKNFDLCKILGVHEKKFKLAKFVIIVLSKGKCWKIEQHLEVEIAQLNELNSFIRRPRN